MYFIDLVISELNNIKSYVTQEEYDKMYGVLTMSYSEACKTSVQQHRENIKYLTTLKQEEYITVKLSYCIDNMIDNFEFILGVLHMHSNIAKTNIQ